eukprot:366085-Chlamydomonas_euryale.AAC.1
MTPGSMTALGRPRTQPPLPTCDSVPSHSRSNSGCKHACRSEGRAAVNKCVCAEVFRAGVLGVRALPHLLSVHAAEYSWSRRPRCASPAPLAFHACC